MAQIVVALGSNLNNPISQLRQAKQFLESLSETIFKASSLYASEPLGSSDNDFLNGVVLFDSKLKPEELFEELKKQENHQGRPSRYPKWIARTLDLDIIAYDDLVLQTDTLIIPHKEYTQRLFVLLPLKDVLPEWEDPMTAQTITQLINNSPQMRITKTKLNW